MNQKYGVPPEDLTDEEVDKLVEEYVAENDPTISQRKKQELRFRTGLVADRWLRGKLVDAGCHIDDVERISFGFAQMSVHVSDIWDTARTVLEDWVERKFIEPPGTVLADKLIAKYGMPEDIIDTFKEVMDKYGIKELTKENVALLKKKILENLEHLEPK